MIYKDPSFEGSFLFLHKNPDFCPKNVNKSKEIALVLLQILAKYVMIMMYIYI